MDTYESNEYYRNAPLIELLDAEYSARKSKHPEWQRLHKLLGEISSTDLAYTDEEGC